MTDAVIVALGSNLGESVELIHQTIDRLRNLGGESFAHSSLWSTSPVDCPPGSPDFVNAVAMWKPRANDTPESLLAALQSLEREFGRRPKRVHNEPRPLDLDLIAFGRETRATATLTLPHPRAHLRQFVLQPLSEIAPSLVLPAQTKSVAQLLSAIAIDPTMKKVA